MAISKKTVYTADDGRSYASYGEAKSAQARYVKEQIAIKAVNKQKEMLYRALGELSSNTGLNSIIVTDLVINASKAIKLRDALNRVVDYHRRKNNKKND